MNKTCKEYGDIDGFLRALTKLTKRYGIVIGGCGCCDSPWLAVDGKVKGSLQYCIPEDPYDPNPAESLLRYTMDTSGCYTDKG